ncbi:MAG: hypothetical protein RLZZ32_215, partial [Cyanobacteriota bacterium]
TVARPKLKISRKFSCFMGQGGPQDSPKEATKISPFLHICAPEGCCS